MSILPKLLPVLATVCLVPAAFAAKETARLELIKDDKAYDTVNIWMDYAVEPAVPPQSGKWSDWEKDSVWTEDGAKHVKYQHAFLVIKDGRKGSGFDYISWTSTGDDLPQYSSNCSFNFPGDTLEQFSWDPGHFQYNDDIEPPEEGLGYGPYGSHKRFINNTDILFPSWVRMIGRVPGWVGEVPVAVTLGKPDRSRGFLLPGLAGRPLRAPEGQTLLRVFDSQGRIQWETRVLHPETSVDLPQHIPQGLLHYRWGEG